MKSHSDSHIGEVGSIMQLDFQEIYRSSVQPIIYYRNSSRSEIYTTINPRQTKVYLLEEIKDMVEDAISSSECDSSRQEIMYEVEPAELPVKKKQFRHLESVIELKWKEGLKKSAALPPGRTEIEYYFTTIESTRKEWS